MAEKTIRHESDEDTEENNHTGAELGGIGGAVAGDRWNFGRSPGTVAGVDDRDV